MIRIIDNILIMWNSEYILRQIIKHTARRRTWDAIRIRLRKKIYMAVAEEEPPALESSLVMSSRKRVLMSGKKSSSGKTSPQSLSVREFDSAPQKSYHPSPVQDSKQRGLGGLLSRLFVHTTRRGGEKPKTGKWSRIGLATCVYVYQWRWVTSFIGMVGVGEHEA